MSKQHIFNLKVNLKSLEANCHRSSCKVHATLKIQNQQRKFRQIAQMKKNTAIFNTDLQWELVGIDYDQITGMYGTKNAIISIMYETQDKGSRSNKLKVGHVTINLGNILNEKSYRMHNYYSLQKCYDQAAKIKLAIDFMKIQEAAIRGGGQKLAQDQYARLKQAMQWRTSKMKQRILDQEKTLLQNKLFEYEDKLQKYRDSHNDQMKRITQQLERKQERINLLTQQNSSLTTALQSLQVINQKQKSTINFLEQQMFQIRQKFRSTQNNKDNLSNEIINLQSELSETRYKLDQIEKARQKKQQYFKAQLQKYNKKYLQTENARNRIVFEMQAKLKEQLQYKDNHYKQIIQKLQSKLSNQTHTSKQNTVKINKEIVIVRQNLQKVQKDKNQMSLQIEQLVANKQLLLNTKKQNEQKIEQLQKKLKAANSENQISQFSNGNLQKELNKLKQEKKILAKQNDDLKYEIQLANRTIQENQQTIVKLHRQLKTHRQRQYYMEQKFQDQLQIKTYNQECMRGTNSHYRNQIKRISTKLKLTEQRMEQAQDRVSSIAKQKQKIQQQLKKLNNEIFEANQRQIRYETQNRSLKTSIQQSAKTCHSLEIQLLQIQKSYQNLVSQNSLLQQELDRETENHREKIRTLEQKLQEQKQEYDYIISSDMQSKNIAVIALENQLTQQKQQNKHLKSFVNQQCIKLEQSEYTNRSLTQKMRSLQRQNNKIKIEINQQKQEMQRQINEINKLRRQINILKEQNISKSSQCQSLFKKTNKIKQGYIQLINWALQRILNLTSQNKINNAMLTSSRQYIQSIQGDIGMELVHHINNCLEKVYNQWDRVQKNLFQNTQEKDRLQQQLTKIKYEQNYQVHNDSGTDYIEDKIEQHIQSLNIKFNTKLNSFPLNKSDSQGTFRENPKVQQMKKENRQLQNELTQKIYDLQTTKQQFDNEKRVNSSLKEQVRDLQDELQDLKRKMAQLKNNQYQNVQKLDQFSLYGIYHNKSPRKDDIRTDIEAKFRQKKALEEAEAKAQQYVRQISLQKAKIELLENKNKSSQDIISSMEENMHILQQSVSSLETEKKRLQKAYEQQKDSSEGIGNQMEIMNAKYMKKQKQFEDQHKQVMKLQKSIDILTQKLEKADGKHFEDLKQIQAQILKYKSQTQKLEEQLCKMRIQNEGLTLQIQSLKQMSTNDKRQWQGKCRTLESSLQKSKNSYQQLYTKYIALTSQKSQLQQRIKDIEMNANIAKQSLKKNILQLQQRIQSKQYELEQLKFTSQSKIIQLQKEIQELINRE